MSPSPSDDGGVTVERATERNRLLLALPPDEYERLGGLLETVPFGVRQAFYEPGEDITHVYFPQAGVVSQTVGLNGGAVVVEVATVGREGIVGLPVFLNGGSSLERVFGQISGQVKRIETKAFRRVLRDAGALPRLLLRYTQVALNHVAQTAGCNRAHELEQRCARWLLLIQDRVDGNVFDLKQEFLGYMLGVHRPSVSVAAGVLQKAGLIRYTRGRITIVDRVGLQRVACECYGIMVQEYQRLMGFPQN